MRGLNLPSALPLIQLKTAASRNDPPFKTLGLKTQNNTMTTSRLNLVIQSARICLQHAQNLQHLKTSEDSGPLLGLSQALPHQSLLPCGVSSVSAELYCNHVYRSAESICSARHLKTSRAETTGDPCGEVDTILACHDSEVGQTHMSL